MPSRRMGGPGADAQPHWLLGLTVLAGEALEPKQTRHR